MQAAISPARSAPDARALTLLELLVVIAILALLAWMLLPAITRREARSPIIECAYHLKRIGIALRQFAADHRDRFPMEISTNQGGSLEWGGQASRHFLAITNDLATPRVLLCPTDKERTSARDWLSFGNQNLSYFISLDADRHEPQMILASDRIVSLGALPARRGLMTLTTNRLVGFFPAIHRHRTIVLLADGSVIICTPAQVRDQLQKAENPRNRVAIP